MAVIMLTVLFSRFFYIPGYLSKLGLIEPLDADLVQILKYIGDSVLYLALFVGAYTVISSLLKGMREHKQREAARGAEVPAAVGNNGGVVMRECGK
jgi:hypothetical protein